MTILRLLPYRPQVSPEEPPNTSQAAKMDGWPADRNETMSPASPFTGESSHRTSYAPSGHSPATSYTSAMLDSPGPPLLNKRLIQPITMLADAVRTARDAEMIHAYDIGVCAALESMIKYWSTRSARRHVSSSEKRIFRREAQRLQELMEDAKKELETSQRDLATWKKEEDRLWQKEEDWLQWQSLHTRSRRECGKCMGGEPQGGEVDADVEKTISGFEHVNIQGSTGLGAVESLVRDVEARNAAEEETKGYWVVLESPLMDNVKTERG